MPLLETKGAASAQGFGEFSSSGPVNYIEDVFSTYLYTGNGSTQTITNGIDLAGEGGLVWIKQRNQAASHRLFDTNRGVGNSLVSSSTAANAYFAGYLSAFNANGFSVGTANDVNESGFPLASWTFRKQAKFFDVVTYTGNGSNRTISHNLGSVPGCIIVKRTDTAADWQVYHRSLANTEYLVLNTTAAKATGATRWNSTAPTSTVFSLGTDTTVNANGGTYIAYLYAHNAGGFGLAGTDNVISCGSYTGNGSATGPVITLGYEPQWLLVKNTTSTGDWNLIDNMRGFVVGGADAELSPNLSNAESTGTFVTPAATGFQVTTTDAGYNTNSATYIYIAIRRGPMKVPTSGTSVSAANVYTGGSTVQIGFTPDLVIQKTRNTLNPGSDSEAAAWVDRLRGAPASFIPTLLSNQAAAETTGLDVVGNFYAGQTQYKSSLGSSYNAVGWAFKRAPGFFDVVCWTGDGTTKAYSHNLGVVPELAIYKDRSSSDSWFVYSSAIGATKKLILNASNASATSSAFADTVPTSTQFTIGTSQNYNTDKFVAYLFATVAGVSKVGSYTGTGTTQTINCGFTAGSRFVMIKRTDSTGDWYVWDSARGIVAGNDPYLFLNSTAAEVTSTDYIDTAATGFELSSTAPAAINANGGTFIFLAIA